MAPFVPADTGARTVGDKSAGKAGAGEFFVMSALAKLGATVLTYPILLVKQRLQAASKHTHADLKYSGTYDAVRTIWQKEGEAMLHGAALLCQGVHASEQHACRGILNVHP